LIAFNLIIQIVDFVKPLRFTNAGVSFIPSSSNTNVVPVCQMKDLSLLSLLYLLLQIIKHLCGKELAHRHFQTVTELLD